MRLVCRVLVSDAAALGIGQPQIGRVLDMERDAKGAHLGVVVVTRLVGSRARLVALAPRNTAGAAGLMESCCIGLFATALACGPKIDPPPFS